MPEETKEETITETPVDTLEVGSTEEPDATSEEPKAEDTEASLDATEVDAADADTAPDADETEEGADEDEDLDDDTIAALVDAYGDRFTKTKAIQKQISRLVAEQVRNQVAEADRARTVASEADTLVAQGREAVTNIASIANAVQDALKDAAEGKEVAANVFDPNILSENIRRYAAAVGQNNARIYESAIDSGFRGLFDDVLPQLSAEQEVELTTIVNNANRMEQDPNQKASSRGYLMTNLFRFLASRAYEHGVNEERARTDKRKGLKDRVASSNAIAAAKAKLEKQTAPPKTPESAPKGSPGRYTIDDYEAAKKANDHTKAREISEEMIRRSGVAV